MDTQVGNTTMALGALAGHRADRGLDLVGPSLRSVLWARMGAASTELSLKDISEDITRDVPAVDSLGPAACSGHLAIWLFHSQE